MKEMLSKSKQEIEETLFIFKNFSERLGYPPISIEKSKTPEISFSKSETSLSWMDVAAATVALPAIILWGLSRGKDSAKKEIKKKIDAESIKMNQFIEKTYLEIKENLKIAKERSFSKNV